MKALGLSISMLPPMLPHIDVSFHPIEAVTLVPCKWGNQDRINIVGIGNIIITTSTRYNLIPKDVRHVPTICLNFISTGKLDDVGLINYFGEGKWKLTKGSLIMAHEKRKDHFM